MSDLDLLKRGIVHLEVERELDERLRAGRPLIVKAGFDPTAPDLHLGHTVLIQKMRQFQELGHQVVFIVGDFTAMIGDPTGRSQTRPPLSKEQILENAETYKRQVYKILDPDKTRVELNSTWLAKLGPAEVVQLAGRYTVQRMMERNDFKKRVEAGHEIAVHEFLYALFQAYDSVAIDADVELGGQDQLWNLMVGRDIMRRYGKRPQIVMTTPLLEGTDARIVDGKLVGDKMSKSLGNYIGIVEPPTDQYGKLMSISDDLMWRYYLLLSNRSSAEIEALKAGHPMDAKHALAGEVVTRYHGAAEAAQAADAFKKQFSKRELPELIPTFEIFGRASLSSALVATALSKSTSEATRLIQGGGLDVDGSHVKDSKAQIERGKTVLLRAGSRRYARVTVLRADHPHGVALLMSGPEPTLSAALVSTLKTLTYDSAERAFRRMETLYWLFVEIVSGTEDRAQWYYGAANEAADNPKFLIPQLTYDVIKNGTYSTTAGTLAYDGVAYLILKHRDDSDGTLTARAVPQSPA